MSVVSELLRGPKTRLHIGGEWTEGESELKVFDPATEQVLAAVSAAGHDQARAAVDAAWDAAPGWAATAPRQRSDILRRSFEIMLSREEQLAELIVLENGKTYADALGEVRYGAEFFRWFAEEAVRIIGEFRTAPGGDKRIVVMPEPVGVSLMVTPWNFPSAMATRKLGPALAAGCTTILKPASDTPLSALAVVDILMEAGLPSGVVNVVTARGSSGVVDTMLEDPRVRKLSFTGSTEVGRLLMAKAGSRILRTSMELGGNAPFVVFDDADLDAAIEGGDARQDAQRRGDLRRCQPLLRPGGVGRNVHIPADRGHVGSTDRARDRPVQPGGPDDQCPGDREDRILGSRSGRWRRHRSYRRAGAYRTRVLLRADRPVGRCS